MIIKEWKDIDKYSGLTCIIAPQIKMLTNKNQNPNIPYFSKIGYYNLLRIGYNKDKRLYIRMAQAFSKFFLLMVHLLFLLTKPLRS